MKQPLFLDQIRRLLFNQRVGQSSDADLLARFARNGDEDAFAALVQRHGGLVWHACRRMLRDEHLAEDVFQATFLVLARRAAAIRKPDAVGAWLHGVATRLAMKARERASKRETSSGAAVEPASPDFVEEMTVRELRTVLDEELLHLPDKYRYPLVLCYLEGQTRDEAAKQLGCPLETLKSRLERARELLHDRLKRRHLGLPAAFLALLVEGSAQAGPSVAMIQQTARAAALFGSEHFVAAGLSDRAVALAREGLAGMLLAKVRTVAVVAVVVGLLAMAGMWFGPGLLGGKAGPAIPTDVFAGPPAPHVPRLRADLPAAAGPLRRLVVEDRVGAKRTGELVRVPLFFHEGECAEPHALQVFAQDDAQRKTPIAYQPDDVRRAEDGSVSRMHVYFPVDLQPWERKRFVVVPGENPGKKLPALAVKQAGGKVTLAGDDLQLTFWSEGKQAGAIASVQTTAGKVSMPGEQLAPRLTLQRQDFELKVTRTSEVSYQQADDLEVRDLRFGAGPLFAKLIVRVGPKGKSDSAEFTYHVPRTGSLFTQTERLFPEEYDSTDVVGTSANTLLTGRVVLGDSAADQRVVSVPAGLRKLTRSIQGHRNAALVNAKAGLSLFPIPYVQTGVRGIEVAQDGDTLFVGTTDFKRTAGAASEDLRAFWGQVNFVFTKAVTEEALWEVSRRHFQPLTAVVDEPGIASDDLHARLKELMKQFPATHSRSWMQEVGRLYTLDDAPGMQKLLDGGARRNEDLPETWLTSANKAKESLTKGGTIPLKEFEKGRASGLLDPWNLTYGCSPMFSLAALGAPADKLDRICLAIGKAQREFNGRVDAHGFPYVDCFNTAFNMQIGSIQAGIHGARKADDPELLQFYRDCARSASVLDIYGHGHRTYPSLPKGAGVSDFLYQANCDFFLRATELACNEDLWLHPAAYGRYFDCIDVNADQCHRRVGESKRPPSWYRANFFPGQCHDHRWESWATSPYLGILARASDRGSVGLTEACYFAGHEAGHWVNWPEITTFFHADLAVREGLKRYRPEPAPALPANVQATPQAGKTLVRWQPLADKVLGYRVYRADRTGGPWTLLNSPYTKTPAPLVTGSEYTDAEGKPGQVYFVTAVDLKRRESRWFPEEPLQTAGGE